MLKHQLGGNSKRLHSAKSSKTQARQQQSMEDEDINSLVNKYKLKFNIPMDQKTEATNRGFHSKVGSRPKSMRRAQTIKSVFDDNDMEHMQE